MRRITLWLLLCAAVGAFYCVVAYAQESDELEDLKPGHLLFIMKDGSMIKGKVAIDKWKLKTAYGELVIPAGEIGRIRFPHEAKEDEVQTVRFTVTGSLVMDKVEVDTGKGKLTIPKSDIKEIVFPGVKKLLKLTVYGERLLKRCLAREGGSRATEKAVAAALKWLQAHQDKDGKWDQDGFQKNCKGAACDGQGTSQYDVAVSSLALLAFMGSGYTHKKGNYKDTVKRGLDWLVMQQQADGSLGPRLAESWIYNHAMGTAALCEAYALSKDRNLKAPAEKAVNFILRAQNPGLGWKYEPRSGRNDTSVTGWMVTALKAAKTAGLQVPNAALQGAVNWFDRATNTAGKCGYMRPGDDGSVIRGVNEHFAKLPTMTAVAVYSRILCGQKRKEQKILKGVDILMANLPNWNKPKNDKVDPYYWYYGTCAMFQYGGQNWAKWNTAMKKALVETQRKGGCASGSWDPVGKWSMVGGRVCTTALNCLTLEVYYRYTRYTRKK